MPHITISTNPPFHHHRHHHYRHHCLQTPRAVCVTLSSSFRPSIRHTTMNQWSGCSKSKYCFVCVCVCVCMRVCVYVHVYDFRVCGYAQVRELPLLHPIHPTCGCNETCWTLFTLTSLGPCSGSLTSKSIQQGNFAVVRVSCSHCCLHRHCNCCYVSVSSLALTAVPHLRL
jgi:hypothetical protein